PPSSQSDSKRSSPLFGAILASTVFSLPLLWILARVIWLPMYFGVFFFLVGGMLAGAVGFRVARRLRPLPTRRIVSSVATIGIVAVIVGLTFEYTYRAETIGEPPLFSEARADALKRRVSTHSILAGATNPLRSFLSSELPPGGPIGYLHWAATSGRVRLRLSGGFSDEVVLGHTRWTWIIRTLGAYGLFIAGLWYQFEALRAAAPTTNVL